MKWVEGPDKLVGPVSEESFEVGIGVHDLLLCPVCLKNYPDGRGVWLHQEGVEGFFREEDSDKGIHGYIADTGSFLAVDENCGRNARNPSSRRDGLIIYFSCEWCSPLYTFELRIAQHKGVTMMEWLVKQYRQKTDMEDWIEEALKS